MSVDTVLSKLTYANVTATIALFIAIGGSSYAALRVGSGDIVNNSVRSSDLRNNSVRSRDIRNFTIAGRDARRNAFDGEQIREAGLGAVPLSLNSERLSGVTIFDLKVRCSDGTVVEAGLCFEGSPRAATAFRSANAACANDGRRLPTYAELDAFHGSNAVAAPGEWTSSVYRNQDNPGTPSEELEVIAVTPDPEGIAYRLANTPAQLPFRCVASPSN